MSKLNAVDICAWQPEAGLLATRGLSHICSTDFESELLDLNELTIIEDKSEGINPGGIYKDKYGNIWFIKESIALREYVGGHILELFLGSNRIAEIKLVKGYPSLVASKKLENFYPMQTLIKSEQATTELDEIYPLLNNYEELLVGMNYVSLGDRHSGNQGYIKKNKILEAARVDYDWSFVGKGKKFFSKELFKTCVDYGKLETAIIKLLNLPDDQIHQILENGAHLEFFDEDALNTKFITDDHNHLVNYLEGRKKNLKQLLPLIACLKKVLNEGDMNYLNENKDMLITFQNAMEPDSGLSYLNMLMHQVVERGCLEALKKLKELGFYEHDEKGYGFKKEELPKVAYEAKQHKVLDYLLENDETPLGQTLYSALQNSDYDFARKLIKNILLHPSTFDVPLHHLGHMLRWSVEANDLNLVKGIVKLGGDIKTANHLLYAALTKESAFEVLQYLLENGAEAELAGRPDLIHNAAQKKRADVVELFVQYGADPYLRDGKGKTAYDYLN